MELVIINERKIAKQRTVLQEREGVIARDVSAEGVNLLGAVLETKARSEYRE
jgi:hypothetical protein